MTPLQNRTIRRALGVWTLLALIGIGYDVRTPRSTAIAQTPGISTNINDYVVTKLEDFSAIIRVMQHNDDAGQKINKDFGVIYELKGNIKVRYKEENKLRLDARNKTANIIFVMNGSKQSVRFAGIHTDSNLGNEPGKRKTLLDVGLISKGYLAYSNAEYKGTGVVDGVTCAKFRLTYKDFDTDSSHRLIWIDPKTKVTMKREDYSQESKAGQSGKLNATYIYLKPIEVAPGIWFPTRISALNNEGQKAGELSYNDIKVNQGIDDSTFNP